MPDLTEGTEDGLDLERDAVDCLYGFIHGRETESLGKREAAAFRPAIDAYFKTLPVGAELWDDEHGVGLRKANGAGSRSLNFETAPVDLLEWAAKAGLLSLNVGALDGALASSDDRTQHYARQLNAHVRNGFGTQLTTLRKPS